MNQRSCDPVKAVLDNSTARGCGPKQVGEHQWEARCPAHEDTRASLSISVGDDGRVLLHCHAGCKPGQVVEALGMEMADLFPRKADNGGVGKPKKVRGVFETWDLLIQWFGKVNKAKLVGTWAYHDCDGKTVFAEVRFQPDDGGEKISRPVSRVAGGFKLCNPPGVKKLPLYRLPKLAAAKTVLVFEGARKADEAMKLGFVATASYQGAASAKKTDWTPLAGKEVIISPDNDDPGRGYAEDVARIVTKLRPPATVKVVTLPDLPEGGDIVDWLGPEGPMAGKEPDEIRAAIQEMIEKAPTWEPKPEAGKGRRGEKGEGLGNKGERKARFDVRDIFLDQLTCDVLAELTTRNDPPVLFVRGGELVRVIRDEDGRPRIDPMDRAKLRYRLSEVAHFVRAGKEITTYEPPPQVLVDSIQGRGEWPLPPLRAISTVPVLRPDGTLHCQPGYDPETRVCYLPDGTTPAIVVPEHPTVEEVEAATGLLLDLVGDFPFNGAADRANGLAVLLSVLMRPAIRGCIPLAVFNAPERGTGKTLLATILGTVAVGSVAVQPAPSRGDDAEWRKRISAVLLEGPPMVILDNLPETDPLNSPSLAAVLTSLEWADRRLGKSETIRVPAQVVWCATGNNVRLANDMPRRAFAVRLDANTERPWQRTGFRHPDLLGYAREHRHELLEAGFTIVRAWFAAGCPKAQNVPVLGSFEAWSGMVGGVLEHAGVPGFLANLDAVVSTQDDELAAWQRFFEAWWDRFGDKAQTVELVYLPLVLQGGIPTEELPDQLSAAHSKGTDAGKRSLGQALSRLKDRIIGGRKLVRCGEDRHSKVTRWRLNRVG